MPSQVDRVLFMLAPALSVVPAMIAFAVIPFGGTTTMFGLLSRPVALQITDIDVGVLYVFGITSLGVYGIVLAGWSSNNKYSLLGGLRASAQMISYELSMGLAVVGVLILSSSLRLSEIVHAQAGVSWWLGLVPLPKWFIFGQPLGFVIFFWSERPTGRPSICRKPRASWLAVSTPSTPRCASPCSSWPNT
jgi:NADH-quinone oxidoreductase subunit H